VGVLVVIAVRGMAVLVRMVVVVVAMRVTLGDVRGFEVAVRGRWHVVMLSA
jgi:hypothetical protein